MVPICGVRYCLLAVLVIANKRLINFGRSARRKRRAAAKHKLQLAGETNGQ